MKEFIFHCGGVAEIELIDGFHYNNNNKNPKQKRRDNGHYVNFVTSIKTTNVSWCQNGYNQHEKELLFISYI